MKGKVIVVFLMLLWVAVWTPKSWAVEVKLGVVNIQDVLDNVEEGKKAKAQFEKFYLERKKDLEDQKKGFDRMQESFEKQKLILSPSAMDEKKKELEERKADLQKSLMNAQADTQKKEMELTGEILKKIRAVIEKLGREGGYTMVLEKAEAGVVFYGDQLDLTQKVVGEFNKVYGGKK